VYRLFVFDLDGTLIDSSRDIAESANLMLESYGAQPLAEAAIRGMVGEGAATLVARALDAAGVTGVADGLERYLAIYDTRLLLHTRAYPGVADVLSALSGRAALAVFTNKPLAASRRILEGLDLARHFESDAVLGGDGPFPRKPEPSGLVFLAERACVPVAETLMVGDSITDWKTAKRASTGICMARYGFGFDRFPVEDLAAGDHVIDQAVDLLRL